MRHARDFTWYSSNEIKKKIMGFEFHLALRFRGFSLVRRSFLIKRSSLSLCLLVLVFAANLGWAVPPQATAKNEPGIATATAPNWTDELNKYPGLMEEYGRLLTRFQREIKLPPSRTQSQLLRMMPETTTAYVAFPNYGAAAHQALDIFHEELKSSAPLRDWWQHSQANSKGPSFETVLTRYYQLFEFLGDEVVASGTVRENSGGVLLMVAVKKPGVEEFLRGAVNELAGQSKPPQVLNVKELATAKDDGDRPVILVRPDFVIFGSDLKTLRSFNSKLGSGEPTLETTAFGKRVSESYQQGVEILAAADLQTILGQMPKGKADDQMALKRSGFADVKYGMWEYANLAGQAPNQAELSFTGPRHGVASWLAAPGRLAGLEFVSPDAAVAMSVLLKNPAEILADIKELAPPGPQGSQLAAFEPILAPILSRLTGEITAEIDPVAIPTAPGVVAAAPEWKVILGTRDGNALQQMLAPLVTGLKPRQVVKDGETYYLLQTPAKTPMEISYSYQPGYLVIGSSQREVAKAVLAHRSGKSLSTSPQYRAALPPGQSSEASGILYQNSAGFMTQMMSRLPAELTKGWLPSAGQSFSAMSTLYGEEASIRAVSNSATSSVVPVMVVAAIAIPNLLRSRMAANEASAVGSVRTVNTAQVVYEATYTENGFARDLASLGGSPNQRTPSATHALLLDSTLACPAGTTGSWCTKSGYKFTVHASCMQGQCFQYVVVATPESSSSGQRSFCSTKEGVIRFKAGPPVTSAISATECKSWIALR
jgi:hypothetical protein